LVLSGAATSNLQPLAIDAEAVEVSEGAEGEGFAGEIFAREGK
jgi:hypothetical protein